MINVSFLYNGAINGYPSWVGYDGTTQLVILWTGLYWVMTGWPYDGEPRNYNNTLNPTTGWELYDNTTLTATFNVVLGACPIPTPSPTVTPSRTPPPSVTPGISPTPTPSITPSQVCNTPSLSEVTFVQRGKINNNDYIFNLFFDSDSNCSGMIYEYSCDNITWQTCIYNSCVNSFGCQSPVQINIELINFCTACGASWYFRIKQCCSNGLQSNYSNVIQVLPPSPSPSRTPSVTRTPSRTPSITPTKSITPSITATPSVTATPSISPTPGSCRYISELESSASVGDSIKIQYTNCAGVLRQFGVYLPAGNNIIDVSTLNICMRVGTPLTVIAGSAPSVQPIFGAYCS
jgi:hypothetical protein